MWNAEELERKVDEKVQTMNFVTYKNIIDQSVAQFKKGIALKDQVFKWVYYSDAGYSYMKNHDMYTYCLTNRIAYRNDYFIFGNTAYNWKTEQVFHFPVEKPTDEVSQDDLKGLSELDNLRIRFVPTDYQNKIVWRQTGVTHNEYMIYSEIVNEWLTFYLVRDNDDGPPQVFDRKAINRYYSEAHDEWELYGRIDYSCPGRARLCVLNTHNNPYQRSVKVPYI